MELQIITNPSKHVFLDLVSTSREQLLASPFVKANVTQLILDNKPKDAKISLLTSYKLTNFYRNSSDLSALRSFIQTGADVRNWSRLHAKTYIFDSERALVTSANLTMGGLENNYECGVLIQHKPTVALLKMQFTALFDDTEQASSVTEDIITTTESILSKVPKERRVAFTEAEKELFPKLPEETENDLYDAGIDTIRDSLKGWRLDVFDVLLTIPADIFYLDNVYAHRDPLQQLYPTNQNVDAKIRQQLQELRDLGLLEFCGRGVYRKLWKNV